MEKYPKGSLVIYEFFYEIIIAAVIFVAIIVYFLVARLRHEEDDLRLKLSTSNDPLNFTTKKTLKPIEMKEFENENESEEIISSPFKHTQTPLKSQKKQRKTVEVPPHGKITKENFKEFKGVKLLVAEDNNINQKVISGLLSGSGIFVTMANDGQEALDILQDNSDFDMILMDVEMPRMDGFEATRRIRANTNYEHIVIISLSANVLIDDIQKMTNVGMEGHLAKPLKMDALYDILYAYTKKESAPTDTIEIVMTNELNGNRGLSICGGDEEFYRDILMEFVNNYKYSPKVISQLLEKKDTNAVDELLLDFVGITANIGADSIKEIALELKETIKDSEEKTYLTMLENFEVHLHILLDDIDKYLSEEERVEEPNEFDPVHIF